MAAALSAAAIRGRMPCMNEVRPLRRRASILRIIRARPRLFVCAAIGLFLIAVLPASWRLSTRLLIGWDAAIALYLALALETVIRSDVSRIRWRAALQDEGATMLLIITVTAAVASLGAILAELGIKAGERTPVQLGIAVLTIVLSWALIHIAFALHYAHEFYDPDEGKRGGLAFPGEDRPDYWDFVYFSLVIGMTSQVSDVAVTSGRIRRIVAAHGVVSFFFNASLIALAVNIAASAL